MAMGELMTRLERWKSSGAEVIVQLAPTPGEAARDDGKPKPAAKPKPKPRPKPSR